MTDYKSGMTSMNSSVFHAFTPLEQLAEPIHKEEMSYFFKGIRLCDGKQTILLETNTNEITCKRCLQKLR